MERYLKLYHYEPHKQLVRTMMKLEKKHEKTNPNAVITLRRLEKKWLSFARKLKEGLGV
jgi:CMP-2-keto-3-deoxyoctulosonic acid synthetase